MPVWAAAPTCPGRGGAAEPDAQRPGAGFAGVLLPAAAAAVAGLWVLRPLGIIASALTLGVMTARPPANDPGGTT